MVASAFMMLAPVAKKTAVTPGDQVPASVEIGGTRQVTYTISNLGESYLKVSDNTSLGRHGSTPVLSEWWTMRQAGYGDTITHNAFPYTVTYDPNSMNNKQSLVPKIPYGTYSFYKVAVDAQNLTTVATGPNKDPLFLPVMGNIADDGGTVHFNFHITYLTSDDVNTIKVDKNYANAYYGVHSNEVSFGGAYVNDGWYIEQSGTFDMDRAAAHKILNLNDTGSDLRTDFSWANRRGAGPAYKGLLNNSWGTDLVTEGGPGGIYDIYAAYDYSINSGPVLYFLKLDPTSTTTKLVVRVWGYSWGAEALNMRYMDVAGILKEYEPYMEDWYLNGTIASAGADISSTMVGVYHMMGWKDATFFNAAWLLEPQHIDYTYADVSWMSEFNPYDIYRGYLPSRQQWIPGTSSYGGNVAYWTTPTYWKLAADEKLVVKLGSGPYQGITPYKGTTAESFGVGGNPTKAAEIQSHAYWGELVMGHGYPASLYSATYYNSATKTLTLQGPYDPTSNPNGAFPLLNATGSPQLIFDVARVSNYTLQMVESPPYTLGATYHLSVTAKNFTDVTVTGWNGTVDLTASAGVTLGALSHLFVPATDNGVWTTTIVFSTNGLKTITTADRNLPLDVFGSATVDVPGSVIPEFPTLLIPVMGGAAVIVAFIRRDRKNKE